MRQWAVGLVMDKYKDIGEHFVAAGTNQRTINRAYLHQYVIFLARRGLPFRGNWIPSEDSSGGCEKESNIYQ